MFALRSTRKKRLLIPRQCSTSRLMLPQTQLGSDHVTAVVWDNPLLSAGLIVRLIVRRLITYISVSRCVTDILCIFIHCTSGSCTCSSCSSLFPSSLIVGLLYLYSYSSSMFISAMFGCSRVFLLGHMSCMYVVLCKNSGMSDLIFCMTLKCF